MIYKGRNEKNLKSYIDPSKIRTDSFQTLTSCISSTHKDNLCFRYFENTWHDTTFNEFSNNVFRYARFFTQKKLTNKNILILSESRPEIIELYYACFCANAISVPVDVKLSGAEVAYILNQVRPSIIFVTEKLYALLIEASKFINFDLSIIAINKIDKHYSLKDIPDNNQIKLPPEDIYKTGMIVYTSGSTGKMKGVETSGSQLLYQIHTLMRIGFSKRLERNLSMLPMNHLFEVTGTISSLSAGFPICISHGLEKEDLGICFQKHHPTQIYTVPLFCKSIMNGIKLNIADSPLAKRIVFGILMFLAKIIPSMNFRKKLFAPVHQKFGGSLHRMIVGGAACDLEVINFFKLLGIEIYEGYGLTETAPVIAVNRVNNPKPGSVGSLLPGVEVKFENTTGEIHVRGPLVMRGYYKDAEATSQVLIEDGWFKTGDIGHLSESGHLFITGRSKNLIILESGKKVHPEEVMKAYDDIDFIKEISIFGDKTKGTNNSKNIILVAYLDEEFTKKHKDEVKELLTKNIQERADRLANYKRPTKIIVSPEELPKTTTMKVKHFLLEKKYNEGLLK